MSDWRIPLFRLQYGDAEEAAALRVLRSGWLSIGPEVAALERAFAERIGVRHAVAVSSGTAALHLALVALDLQEGDEVIQPAINFVAAANMTVAVGAVPVFADIIGVHEPTLDPAAVEALIGPRTRAVLMMDCAGYPCRAAELSELCRSRGIALIEDAAHAAGARYIDPHGRPPHGRMAGALGDVGTFSFFANKNIVAGEGGTAVTDDDARAERLRLLRSHGMTTLSWDRYKGHASSYDVLAPGFNYRMDELHAALAAVQLGKLDENNRRRAKCVERYAAHLRGLPGWALPFPEPRGESAFHIMVAVAPSTEVRDAAVAALREARIQTSLHYPCITDFAAFRSSKHGGLARSREFAARAISLPLYPDLTDDHVDAVCAVLAPFAA